MAAGRSFSTLAVRLVRRKGGLAGPTDRASAIEGVEYDDAQRASTGYPASAVPKSKGAEPPLEIGQKKGERAGVGPEIGDFNQAREDVEIEPTGYRHIAENR